MVRNHSRRSERRLRSLCNGRVRYKISLVLHPSTLLIRYMHRHGWQIVRFTKNVPGVLSGETSEQSEWLLGVQHGRVPSGERVCSRVVHIVADKCSGFFVRYFDDIRGQFCLARRGINHGDRELHCCRDFSGFRSAECPLESVSPLDQLTGLGGSEPVVDDVFPSHLVLAALRARPSLSGLLQDGLVGSAQALANLRRHCREHGDRQSIYGHHPRIQACIAEMTVQLALEHHVRRSRLFINLQGFKGVPLASLPR